MVGFFSLARCSQIRLYNNFKAVFQDARKTVLQSNFTYCVVRFFLITGYLVSVIFRVLHLKDSNQATDAMYIALLWFYLVSISYKACSPVLKTVKVLECTRKMVSLF